MASALNNLKRVDMPLSKETKPNLIILLDHYFGPYKVVPLVDSGVPWSNGNEGTLYIPPSPRIKNLTIRCSLVPYPGNLLIYLTHKLDPNRYYRSESEWTKK